MDQPAISSASLEFRARMVKVIHENSFLKNHLSRTDRMVLSEKYKSLINSINGFIVICNYTTGMYEYISDGIQSNLGYDVSNYSNEALTDFVFSTIREDHREFLLNTLLPTVFKYFKDNSTSTTGTDYRYTCSFKIKNVYGVYHWYLLDTVLLDVDENGFPLTTLITCTNINQFKKDELIYYNILKKNGDGVYEVMLEGTQDHAMNVFKLTSREMQIINLISQGYTNKHIADKLFISLNTVQTHRKSIKKKTKCSGTAALTNFAFSRGLL